KLRRQCGEHLGDGVVGKLIGRVGEHHREKLIGCGRKVGGCFHLCDGYARMLYDVHIPSNYLYGLRIRLDQNYLIGTPGGSFQSECAGAGKNVEDALALKSETDLQ